MTTITAEQKDSGQNTSNETFDFRCFGSDNYISEFQIKAGDYIDGFTIKCKNDSDQYFPWAGGQGGSKTIIPSQQGFSKIGIDSKEYIYGMELYD